MGYGGYNTENSRDLMKVKVGNIFSGQEVRVKISYVHAVSVLVNTFYEFRLPTSVTPRYVGKIDAGKLIH